MCPTAFHIVMLAKGLSPRVTNQHKLEHRNHRHLNKFVYFSYLYLHLDNLIMWVTYAHLKPGHCLFAMINNVRIISCDYVSTASALSTPMISDTGSYD